MPGRSSTARPPCWARAGGPSNNTAQTTLRWIRELEFNLAGTLTCGARGSFFLFDRISGFGRAGFGRAIPGRTTECDDIARRRTDGCGGVDASGPLTCLAYENRPGQAATALTLYFVVYIESGQRLLTLQDLFRLSVSEGTQARA